VDAAWELGITHFDTADAYGGGRSERAIGRWIHSRGVQPMITTKTYNPMDCGADHGLAPERIARQLESSFQRLGVERVDLYLAHDFGCAPSGTSRTWRSAPYRAAGSPASTAAASPSRPDRGPEHLEPVREAIRNPLQLDQIASALA
jgi:hypothetical protein